MIPADIIAIVSAGVAALGAASSWWFAQVGSERDRRNQAVALAAFKDAYFAGLRSWAESTSDILSHAIHFSELDPARCPDGEFFRTRNEIRTALSSLTDRGRWYFPNFDTDQHGVGKPEAFRGYRRLVLDNMVRAYNAVTLLSYESASHNPPLREALVVAKREFVTEIQKVLSPQTRDEEFLRITRPDLPS